MPTERVLLNIANVTKSYGGVLALREVSLELRRGEVHALCGENGAGKSTLIKCLTGVESPDAGGIHVEGQTLPFGDVRASEAAGIAALHQESTALCDLNAVDNIFVGREPKRLRGLMLDRARMRRETVQVLGRLGQQLDLRRPVGAFSVAGRQTVSLARALSQRCRLLIMDEPTASLSARETEALAAIVRRLRAEGVTILYVSHRLDEIFQLADRVTVLRDGRNVGTRPLREINKGDLIRMMVGREVDELAGRHAGTRHPVLPSVGSAGRIGQTRLCVRNLSRGDAFHNISLTVRAGEIVGLAGLVGAGRSEVARAIFGIDRYDAGEVLVDGQRVPTGDVRAAVMRGLALVPEDRQHEGLVLPMTVAENLSLAVLRRLTRTGLVNGRAQRHLVAHFIEKLDVRASGQQAPAETLSGGNQQKLVLGKWLAAEPRVLILDEPTRGVDVGAKAQVHQLIRGLAADGLATLVISSELPELLSMCDRILVLREGRISGEVDGRTATQEQVLQLALPS